jgi:hypothetical protein
MSKQKRFSIESDILRVHDAKVIVSAEFCKENVRDTNMYCSLKYKIQWATDKILWHMKELLSHRISLFSVTQA